MVFVIAQNGVRLMPTTERKARLLLKTGRAEIFRRMPFTIRLLYQSGTATQKCTLGIDTGESHIGISAVSEGHVLCRTEITLRSSMEKRKLMENFERRYLGWIDTPENRKAIAEYCNM